MVKNRRKIINVIYKRLFESFGFQGWWPAKTSLEVIVGAILTQNTSWRNVEKAIVDLKKEKLLNVKSLKKIKINRLAHFIRPAGYYNIKAKRLKNFINYLSSIYGGSLKRFFKKSVPELRRELLSVNGVGPETADSIILYAARKPIFVIDAYTKRFLLKHHLITDKAGYEDIQKLFMDNLKSDVSLFNEYHALIVYLGKNICIKRPKCDICPLKDINRV